MWSGSFWKHHKKFEGFKATGRKLMSYPLNFRQERTIIKT